MTDLDAYAVLADKHGYAKSTRYRRILEFLMTPRQARITADLPLTVEELALKHGLPVDTVRAEIGALFQKGVVIPKKVQTMESPRFARSVGQFHDATQSILDIKLYSDEDKKQLFSLWEDFCEKEWFPDKVSRDDSPDKPPSRVVAAYGSIKDVPGVQPYDDIREILKAQQVIAVASCCCRARHDSIGKPCEHSHDVNCFQLNRGAEYVVTRGTGRELAYEQALAVVDEIEQNGLVHIWSNNRVMTRALLCSCCVDCCVDWHPCDVHKGDIGRYWARSRFVARLDSEICNGCELCAKRCMFGAITLAKVEGSRARKAVLDPEKCYGCGLCVVRCKPGALRMQTARPPEYVPQI